jgi:hypothetical protein
MHLKAQSLPQLCWLPTQVVCSVWFWEYAAIAPMDSINWLMWLYIMETQFVFFRIIRTTFYNIICINYNFPRDDYVVREHYFWSVIVLCRCSQFNENVFSVICSSNLKKKNQYWLLIFQNVCVYVLHDWNTSKGRISCSSRSISFIWCVAGNDINLGMGMCYLMCIFRRVGCSCQDLISN